MKVSRKKANDSTLASVFGVVAGIGCAACIALGSALAHADPAKIALVLDRGGKDDKSFNTAAFRGATEAKQKLGIQLKEIEASDDNLFEPAMRSFARKKYDLIIGIGVAQSETVKKLAREMPGQKFAIVDAKVDAPNVASLLFEEHEGSYVVGYAAALKSKTDTVGFIGGMDIPLIRRFELAYLQGAKAAKPKIKTLVNYIGVTSEAWNNPTKAKELARSQYGRGADVIFVAAGASNNGAFDAAESERKYAIGVDSNQNWMKPGLILTSMLKRVDTAVYQIIEDTAKGKFTGGPRTFGLKNNGIDWAVDENNRNLFTEAEFKKINLVKADIIAGRIKVDDFYKMKK
ncbi:MAG: BMP family ABC transporter substrate-binding protein [Deltaproteobacteria bacterium]|nr:BMP family ABC transporter substrate-binding protein [Deltaproteobacteria bacterium]